MKKVPHVIFKTRIRNPKLKTQNPFEWKDLSSKELCRNKKIIIVALPGAFTPTCSSKHLPEYEKMYDKFKKLGIDDIWCLSVNDAFTMFQWAKKLGIKKVKMLPDGNADFTRKMKMLVKKNNLGFGKRSWRYSMLVDNCKIVKIFKERGMTDNKKSDPYLCSDAKTMYKYLKK